MQEYVGPSPDEIAEIEKAEGVKIVSEPVVQKTPPPVEYYPQLTDKEWANYVRTTKNLDATGVKRWLKENYGMEPDNVEEVLGSYIRSGKLAPVPKQRIARPYVAPQFKDQEISAPAPRGWWETFLDKAGETFSEAGEGVNAFLMRGNKEHREEELIRYWASQNNLSEEQLEKELLANDEARARAIQNIRTEIATYDADEAKRDPGLLADTKRVTAGLAGGIVGDLNPTYLIAPGSSAVTRTAAQGGVNAATDLAVQGAEVKDGIIDEVDPVRVGANFVMGAAFQGTGEALGALTSKWLGKAKLDDSAKGSINSEEQLFSLEDDLAVLAKYEVDANNFTSPEAVSKVANRVRQVEARRAGANPETGEVLPVADGRPNTGVVSLSDRKLLDIENNLEKGFQSLEEAQDALDFLEEALKQDPQNPRFDDLYDKVDIVERKLWVESRRDPSKPRANNDNISETTEERLKREIFEIEDKRNLSETVEEMESFDEALKAKWEEYEKETGNLISPYRDSGKNSGKKAKKTSATTRFEEELRNLQPVRKQQDANVKEFRSQGVRAARQSLNEGKGTSAFFNALGNLKGKAEKAEFESIAEKFTQSDIDELAETIRGNPAFNGSAYDEINAFKGLQKLLGEGGSEIPNPSELKLLAKVFDPDLINGLMKARPLKHKTADALGNLLGLPRAMMSTADLSAPLRQGAFLIRRKEYAKALPDMFKAAGTEQGYRNIMDDISSRPTWDLMQESKLGITDMDGALSQREEDFMSNWAEKIPGFGRVARGSNRAYTGFLNKLRADTFDDFIQKAAERGNDIRDNPEALRAVSAYVNSATGRGDLPKFLDKYAPVLNASLFSPRLISSRINLLTNPMIYARLPKGTRREAAKDFLGYTATAASVLSLASAAGLSVSMEPTSSDFLKIKDGDTRYDILGGFQQYLKLFATLATQERTTLGGEKVGPEGESFEEHLKWSMEQVARFGRSKLSPNASYGVDAYFGENIIGEEFDAIDDAAERMVPLFLQDVYEVAQEEGVENTWKTIPGLFGVSVSSYPTGVDRYGREVDGSVEESDPTVLEIERLDSTLEDNKKVLTRITKGDLDKFEPTEEQMKAFRELAGQYTLDYVRNLQMSDPEWAELSDEEKIEEIKAIQKDMKANAKEELFPEFYGPDAEGPTPSDVVEEEGIDLTPEANASETPEVSEDTLAAAMLKYAVPEARITSTHRGANHALTKKNPNSDHFLTRNAVDIAPVSGYTYEEFLDKLEAEGVPVVRNKSYDETGGKQAAWATGDHWHIYIEAE